MNKLNSLAVNKVKISSVLFPVAVVVVLFGAIFLQTPSVHAQDASCAGQPQGASCALTLTDPGSNFDNPCGGRSGTCNAAGICEGQDAVDGTQTNSCNVLDPAARSHGVCSTGGTPGVCCGGSFISNQTTCPVTSTCTPVSGGWSQWSDCSTSGTQYRSCNTPSPSCGGTTCIGPSSQTCAPPTDCSSGNTSWCDPYGDLCTDNTYGVGPPLCSGPTSGCNPDPTDCPVVPLINLDPTSFNFSSNSGSAPVVGLNGDGVVGNTLNITNQGGGTLNWIATTGSSAGWCYVTPSSGTAPSSITVDVGEIDTPGVYHCSITVLDQNGVASPAVATVVYTVSAAVGAPVVTLTANPTSVPSGGVSNLTWTVSGTASSCVASGGWSGSKATGGGTQGTNSITSNQTYTLTCTGPGGTGAPASATVTVNSGACNTTPGTNQMTGCAYSGLSFNTYVGATSGSPTASGNADNFSALPDYNVITNSGGNTAGQTTNFSTRWYGTFNFSGGTYTFTSGSDDGNRVYVDGNKVIDDWVDQGYTIHNSNVTLTAGSHTVEMEYYQNGGGAEYSLAWALQSPADAAICQSFSANSGQPVVVGATFPVTAVLKNSGTNTWVSAGNQYGFTVVPWDGGSPQYWNNGGSSIWNVLPSSTISPGQTGTFNFNLVAPATPGSYPLQMEMLHNGSYWFNNNGPDGNFPTPTFCTQTVSVVAALNVTAAISADSTSIPYNSSTVIHWSIANSTSAVITSSPADSQFNNRSSSNTGGAQDNTSNLTANTTYTLTAQGPGGPVVRTVTVNVQSPADTCSGGGCGSCSGGVCGGSPGGTPSNSVTALPSTCPATGVALSWESSPGATSYNIYRNTSNTVPGSVYQTSTTNSYTDTTTGGPYYYWIQAVAGGNNSPDKVAANTNSSGGVSATNSCSGGAGPTTVSISNSTCGQITINWSSVAGAGSYNIYRNTTGSGPAAGDLIKSGLSGNSYVDPSSSNLYYYWVSATLSVSGLETSKVAPNSGSSNPEQLISCSSLNMLDSDKDIVDVNGTAVSPAPGACNSHTDPLPSSTVLQLGNTLTFRISLCTDLSTASSTNVSVSDSMINLAIPAAGWNAQYCKGASCSSITPTVSGTSPNQQLNFSGLGAIPPGHVDYYISYNAQLTTPSGFSGTSARFQNSFCTSYNAGGPACSNTPLLPFYIGNNSPTINEVP